MRCYPGLRFPDRDRVTDRATTIADLDELKVKVNMTQTAIALPMEKIAEFCQKWNVTCPYSVRFSGMILTIVVMLM